MKRRNLLFASALLVGVVAALLIFARRKAGEPTEETPQIDPNVVELSREAQRNVGLGVAEVGEQPLRWVLKATGVVSPDQSRVAHIFPLARGIVDRVHVQLGDRVQRGQPLVEYDNIELGQMIGEYLKLRGELKRLQAQQQVARKFLDRAQALIEVEGIAQRELDLRRAEYQQAVAGVESQRADIARVEEHLHRFGMSDEQVRALGGSDHPPHRTASHNLLRAPLGGIITQYNVAQGEVIDRDKELFTIVDTSTVWVLADVYEKDLGQVRTGGTARIKIDSYPRETFTGRISYVSDFLDPSSRTAKVRCVLPNSGGRLKLEMFATVEISSAEVRKALAVTVAALQQIDNDTVIFVERDQTHFEKRVVQVGERTEEWAEVLGGLRKGEKVVTTGSFYLKSALLRALIGEE